MSERLEFVDGELKILAEDGSRLQFIIPAIVKDGKAGLSIDISTPPYNYQLCQ